MSLSVSLQEALIAKLGPPVRIPVVEVKPQRTPPRPAPSAPPPRRYVYEPAKNVHRLPRPEGPDRSFVAAREPGDMANRKRMKHTAELREGALTRVAAGETQAEVSKSLDIPPSVLSRWVRLQREEANGTVKTSPRDDLQSLSRDLAEAMARVSSLKKKLRKLLEDD